MANYQNSQVQMESLKLWEADLRWQTFLSFCWSPPHLLWRTEINHAEHLWYSYLIIKEKNEVFFPKFSQFILQSKATLPLEQKFPQLFSVVGWVVNFKMQGLLMKAPPKTPPRASPPCPPLYKIYFRELHKSISTVYISSRRRFPQPPLLF